MWSRPAGSIARSSWIWWRQQSWPCPRCMKTGWWPGATWSGDGLAMFCEVISVISHDSTIRYKIEISQFCAIYCPCPRQAWPTRQILNIIRFGEDSDMSCDVMQKRLHACFITHILDECFVLGDSRPLMNTWHKTRWPRFGTSLACNLSAWVTRLESAIIDVPVLNLSTCIYIY